MINFIFLPGYSIWHHGCYGVTNLNIILLYITFMVVFFYLGCNYLMYKKHTKQETKVRITSGSRARLITLSDYIV